jgi:hypothetical protein
MNIKKPIGKKAIIAFPDTPVKPVAMPNNVLIRSYPKYKGISVA